MLQELCLYLRVVGIPSIPRLGLDGIIIELDDLRKGELIPPFWGDQKVILKEGRYDNRRKTAG